MACAIIIRRARNDDVKQRMELVRRGFSVYFWETFVFFFFQELTLECCILAGAVLFIFCGASVAACTLLLPGSAATVAVLVATTHSALAYRHAQSLQGELFGFVAELKGALTLSAGVSSVPISFQLNEDKSTTYSQVVGTVSVSEFWGPENKGWIHAMAVHPLWRSRGIGRALAAAARSEGANRGLLALEAAVSSLQGAARAALAAAGWECHGSYERALVGGALSLPLLRLRADLPLA